MFKARKENLVDRYIKLLEESHNDLHTFELVRGIIEYHQDFDLDPSIIEAKGTLSAIYQFYVKDKNECQEYLERASIWELKDLEERIEADTMFLPELSKLIASEKIARDRRQKIKSIESLLTPQEILYIRKQYSPVLDNSDLKR